MNAYSIIACKRDGGKLTAEEIEWFVTGYAADKIPDYQMSALLMAIYLCGMDFEETAALTRAMLESGVRLNWRAVPGKKIDKHSTGGVGDKVSLILAPLAAAAGVKVPMISGRGLGHSGGTLDKLESITGFRTRLTVDEFYRQIEQIGVSLIGQTEQIAPADRKMYALRDATATIESIPLITGSILSKKLAAGLDGLVLDVKVGKGAFMKTADKARALAESLVKTAALNGLPTTVVISRMDQPLGAAVGNWLEVAETIRCLQNEGPQDLMQVTFALGIEMLRLAEITDSAEEARARLEALIRSGAAFDKCCEIVAQQGGKVELLHHPERYPQSKFSAKVPAARSGYIADIDALAVGQAVVDLGGGRRVIEDHIDPKAGILFEKKVGDPVECGEAAATLFSDNETALQKVLDRVVAAVVIAPQPPKKESLIVEILRE